MLRIAPLMIAAALVATGAAGAEDPAPRGPQTPIPAAPEHESCIGDRFETDADLNRDHGISDREIQDLLDLMNGPGA